MRITSSIEYATRLMVQLGRSHGQKPLAAAQLSQLENVPLDYVNQLLLRLRRGGLLVSRRGTSGGYVLSRPPAQIKLGDVMRAVEGEIFEDVCGKYTGGEKDCHHQSKCGISPVWQRLGALIEQFLDGVTLEQLVKETGACGKMAVMMDKISGDKHAYDH